MKLNHWTIEALEHKASVAADEVASPEQHDEESLPQWQLADKELRFVLSDPTTEALVSAPAAILELADYLGGDTRRAEFEAITADLCRVGYFEKYVVGGYSTHRPTLRTVDGIWYEVGRRG